MKIEEISIKLGNLIKVHRIKKHISQEELAWRCQINVNTLGRIEHAEIELKFITLVKIMSELKIGVEELKFIQAYKNIKLDSN